MEYSGYNGCITVLNHTVYQMVKSVTQCNPNYILH